MLSEEPFYFLRHGQTNWNPEHRAQGQTDVPLNATGLAQAEAAKVIVAALDIATICTSPLKRAYDTASILQEAAGCPLRVIEDLRECCWGDGEGQVKGPWYDDWKRGGDLEGAESYGAFIQRALRGINEALSAEGTVLIVAHGGVYWAVQEHVRGGLEGDVPNCVPVRHDPPRPEYPWWTSSVVDRQGLEAAPPG